MSYSPDDRGEPPQGAGPGAPQPPPTSPHRGKLLLILGIVSVLGCYPLGVVTFIIALCDLGAMNSGRIDQRGRGLTTAGLVLGMLAMVELLLVPILAAILFPVFSRARERALQSACISNQKQIIVAAKMYADDWEGVLPDVGSYPNGSFCGGSWTPGANWSALDGPIADYAKGAAGIFKCPAVRDEPAPSYSWNRHLSHMPEALVQSPTTCPLIWDGVPGRITEPGIPLDPSPNDPDDENAWGFYPSGTDGAQALAASRHAGGLILGFLDGHAEFERPYSVRFQRCRDDRHPGFPQGGEAGMKISMYPMDPMRRSSAAPSRLPVPLH